MSQINIVDISNDVLNTHLVFDKAYDKAVISFVDNADQAVEIISTNKGSISDNQVNLAVRYDDVFIGVKKTGILLCNIYFFENDNLVNYESLSLGSIDLTTFSTSGEIPPEPTLVNVPTKTEQGTLTTKSSWPSISGTTNVGIACLDAESPTAHAQDGSQDNPDISTLPNGWSVIAYEERDTDGKSKICLATFKTTLTKTGFYYRKQCYGRLLNNIDLSIYGTVTFEIFDDIVIPISTEDEYATSGYPLEDKYIAFLSGPLKGGDFFKINYVEREIQDDQSAKIILHFDLGEALANFEGSNDANDVSFIITESSLTAPARNLDIWTLPPHFDADGNQLPVANPSIAIPKNNLMLGGEQFVYVVYQAFGETWDVYLKQIRFSENSQSNPQYLAPYEFQPLRTQLIPYVPNDTLYYIVNNIYNSGSQYCVLLDVYLNGKQIRNCDTSGTPYPPFQGMNSSSENARIELTYNISCLGYVPGWQIGDTVTTSELDSIGYLCSSIVARPSSTQWCEYLAECNQYGLFDDPYCPSPYVQLDYEPIDLYTLDIGGEKVSRVIYNAYLPADDTISQVDIMFVVDFNISMSSAISALIRELPQCDEFLSINELSYRFGLTIFGKNITDIDISDPSPLSCGTETMYNGLPVSDSVTGGFTTRIADVQEGLNVATTFVLTSQTHAAVNFALSDSRFVWRENAKRVIYLITNAPASTASCDAVSGNDLTLFNTYKVALALAIDSTYQSGYATMSGVADPLIINSQISESFVSSFRTISNSLSAGTTKIPIIEKDELTYEPTFLNLAELIITYQGDLSGLWPQGKTNFRFTSEIPVLGYGAKGLTDFPYPLFGGDEYEYSEQKVYGIDPVHLCGNPANWVYFNAPGRLDYYGQNVGTPSSEQSDPILIASNATRPTIDVNCRNQVIIAYETNTNGTQIEIKGTGDFSQASKVGNYPKRQTRFLTLDDFQFSYAVTDSAINQLPDIVIDKNNVVHMAWQSNRDNYWEIYYANGTNLFAPVRLTQFESRSCFPSIDIDDTGNIYVAFHDNRFGNYEILIAFKDEARTIPLLEQEAYLSSTRSGYIHYYNRLPLLAYNSGNFARYPGSIWGVKNSDDSGNDNENYIFKIDKNNGQVSYDLDIDPWKMKAVAGLRDGRMFGVTTTGDIVRLSDVPTSSELTMDVLNFTTIGQIPNITGDLNPIEYEKIVLSTDIPLSGTAEAYTGFASISLDASETNRTIAWCSPHTTSYRVWATYNSNTFGENTGDKMAVYACKGSVVYTYYDKDQLIKVANITTSATVDLYSTFYNFALNHYRSYVNSYPSWSIWVSLKDAIGVDSSGTYSQFLTCMSNFLGYGDWRGSYSVQSAVTQNYPAGVPQVEVDICRGGATSGCQSPGEMLFLASNESGVVYAYKDVYMQYSQPNPVIHVCDKTWPISTSLTNLSTTETGGLYIIDSKHIYSCDVSPTLSIVSVPGPISEISGSGDKVGYTFNGTLYIAKIEANTEAVLPVVWPGQSLDSKVVLSCGTQGNRWLSNDKALLNVNFNGGSSGLFVATLNDVYRIIDATGDHANRLWVLKYSNELGHEYLTIHQINTTTGAITRSSVPINVDSEHAALTAISTGDFYLIKYENDIPYLYKSSYPSLSASAASFNFEQVSNTPLAQNIVSLTSDEFDYLYGVSEEGDLYIVDKATGLLSLKGHTHDTTYEVAPLAVIAGIGYQHNLPSGAGGTDGYFNLLVEFYDNINLQGTPITTIDSRLETAAFSGDPSADVGTTGYYEPGKGIYLVIGESAYAYFNACNLTATAFEENTACFAKVYLISPNGDIHLSDIMQSASLSVDCSMETPATTATTADYGCPLQVIVTNTSANQYYDLSIKIYADISRDNFIKEFTLEYNGADLNYATVGDQPATSAWTENGLLINASESKLITIYPFIKSGLMCGVTYYYLVEATVGGDSYVIDSNSFYCSCSVFESHPEEIGQLSRWHSSAHGYSDTRLTDGHDNCMRPSLKTKSDGTAIISFEDYHTVDINPTTIYATTSGAIPKIKMASFKKTGLNQAELFGTGSLSWYNYDPNLIGRDVACEADLFDRPLIVAEQPDSNKLPATDNLQSNSIYYRACEFVQDSSTVNISQCKIKDLEKITLTDDTFISSNVIKKAFVKPEYVNYFTINASKVAVPVVSKCNIKLEIHGTPEVIAFRARNEDQSSYSKWCTWDTSISNYIAELEWKLSGGSGLKDICIQIMTYSGVLPEFCVPIIADYEKVIYDIKLYKTGNALLPQHDGFFVASTSMESSGDIKNSETISIDIYPNKTFGATRQPVVYFDVIQQGLNDQLNLVASYATDSSGREIYKGSFTVYKQDNKLNTDGLAQVRVRFPDTCEEEGMASVESGYTKDMYNAISREDLSADIGFSDALEAYRQQPAGTVGTNITIRPADDPYFVFGDPNYYLNQTGTPQIGVIKKEENEA